MSKEQEHSELSERQWAFHSDRLKWLDQEITRYRDFEWKATSFHAAFFAAVLYLLLGKDSGPVLRAYRGWLGVGIAALRCDCCFSVGIHSPPAERAA